jgi:hypothetical protein
MRRHFANGGLELIDRHAKKDRARGRAQFRQWEELVDRQLGLVRNAHLMMLCEQVRPEAAEAAVSDDADALFFQIYRMRSGDRSLPEYKSR